MSTWIIGLTGGIASGKSALARLFGERGIAVADADLVAREVVEPGQPALQQIAAHFGQDVLDAEGRLDRAVLRQRIFVDAGEKAALEAILHPRIRLRLRELCEQADSPYAIAAIPLLAEAGGRDAYPWLRRILVVDVPLQAQRQRLMQRDRIDSTLADRMIASQATRTQRLALADDVAVNDGGLVQLRETAAELDALYRALAAGS